ncbi:MAG: tRNA pseudouridine(55) synthase TruB [Bacteroidales bacterium]
MENNYKLITKDNLEILSDNIEDYPGGIVIPIDKPLKWTSFNAVHKLRYKFQHHFSMKKFKIGHAGTLDPLATGILIICAGKATKLAETFQAEEKEYIAEVTFGATTPCFDREKEIDHRYPFEHITREGIENILPKFIGEQLQKPPIFSAKMINGVRAYEIARKGQDVKMNKALINIYSIELISFELPILKIRVRCSKGTYIRALARDLGLAANSGAYLTGLRRTMSGLFTLKDAVTIEECDALFN